MSLPILHITTAHSQYVIDQNAGTYTRTRVHQDASDLSVWGIGDKPVPYAEIMSTLEPGNLVVITHSDGTWIRSTPIQSIEEVAA